jgi:uncharacterized protein
MFSFEILVLYITLLAIPILYYLALHRKKISWKEFFGFKIPNWNSIKYALFLTISLVLAYVLIVLIVNFFGITDLENVGKILEIEVIQNLGLVIIMMFIGVFVEEFFFRAFLTQELGIWVSSIFFGLMHFAYGSIVEIIGAFLMGLILAYFWKKKKEFFIIYIGHLLYNLFMILLVYLNL